MSHILLTVLMLGLAISEDAKQTLLEYKINGHALSHRGLKLDGAIGQGEICNTLKSGNFQKDQEFSQK